MKRILTGADAVRAGYVKPLHTLTFPGKGGMQTRAPDRPVLAHGKVRFVGEARGDGGGGHRGRGAGRRRADRGRVPRSAARRSIPRKRSRQARAQLHENVPGNLSLESEAGDAAAVEAAFAKAAHVTRLKVEVTRVAPNPMEPRACMVAHDARDGSYTFHVCMQGVTTLRKQHVGLYRRRRKTSCISWRATSAAVSGSARRPIPNTAC